MPNASRLVFHIGLEKTGSTSFQQFCADRRAALRRRGALYPENPLCARGANHAPLAASYFSQPDARALLIGGRRADRREAVAALKREMEAAACEVALVSAEHFSSRFSSERIAALAEDFSDYACEIAVVVRDPVARALSAYATTIASGRSLTLDQFVDELCRPDNAYLRYRETLEAWQRLFGRVQVFAYREGHDVVGALAAALLPAGGAGEARYWLNASDGAAALERARLRNAAGERSAGWVGRLARGLRGRLRPGPPPTRPRLSDDQRRRLEQVAAPDLVWLRERYGVGFD